jgi:lipopolysaccharide/colanic/teichoic acid biosynthesis glycosyltransferase
MSAEELDAQAHRSPSQSSFDTARTQHPHTRAHQTHGVDTLPAQRLVPVSHSFAEGAPTEHDDLSLVTTVDELRPIVIREQTTAALVVCRARDIVVSLALLAAAAPIMAVLWALVRLDSRGAAVFSHERVGIGGSTFRFFKFRTMWTDARERFPHLYAYEYTPAEIQGLQFKQVVDPRLTRVGRWLRRTSLDELPNLFNVLRGEMTLVGPRPDIPEMQRYYRSDQLPKFAVKPGLTGLAQVKGRNILSFQETIQYDLLYVAGKSFWLDIRILARTVWVVCRQWGAL